MMRRTLSLITHTALVLSLVMPYPLAAQEPTNQDALKRQMDGINDDPAPAPTPSGTSQLAPDGFKPIHVDPDQEDDSWNFAQWSAVVGGGAYLTYAARSKLKALAQHRATAEDKLRIWKLGRPDAEIRRVQKAERQYNAARDELAKILPTGDTPEEKAIRSRYQAETCALVMARMDPRAAARAGTAPPPPAPPLPTEPAEMEKLTQDLEAADERIKKAVRDYHEASANLAKKLNEGDYFKTVTKEAFPEPPPLATLVEPLNLPGLERLISKQAALLAPEGKLTVEQQKRIFDFARRFNVWLRDQKARRIPIEVVKQGIPKLLTEFAPWLGGKLGSAEVQKALIALGASATVFMMASQPSAEELLKRQKALEKLDELRKQELRLKDKFTRLGPSEQGSHLQTSWDIATEELKQSLGLEGEGSIPFAESDNAASAMSMTGLVGEAWEDLQKFPGANNMREVLWVKTVALMQAQQNRERPTKEQLQAMEKALWEKHREAFVQLSTATSAVMDAAESSKKQFAKEYSEKNKQTAPKAAPAGSAAPAAKASAPAAPTATPSPSAKPGATANPPAAGTLPRFQPSPTPSPTLALPKPGASATGK